MHSSRSLFFLAFFCLTSGAFAADPSLQSAIDPADEIFFENHVRPLLIAHCLECHGDDRDDIRGGLDLSSQQGIAMGGDSGSVVEADDIENSLLLKSVRYEDLEMPPQGKLTDAEIDILHQWVRRGLPDPRKSTTSPPTKKAIDLEAGRQYWAFQTPRNASPPAVVDQSWGRTAIDRFILHRLEAANIKPNGDATRETLIRRIHVALTGLPPTPDAIDQFVADPADDDVVIGELVDRLLATHHFGERWGRHWLDVARFAESSGGGRSLMFRNAWRYRDYVVDSFNKDRPLPEFITQQIAGDLLSADSPEERREQLTATSFWFSDRPIMNNRIKNSCDLKSSTSKSIPSDAPSGNVAWLRPMPRSQVRSDSHNRLLRSGRNLWRHTNPHVRQRLGCCRRLPPNEEERLADAAYQKQVDDLRTQRDRLSQTLIDTGYGDLIAKKMKAKAKSQIKSSQSLSGIVIDNRAATIVGQWTESTSVAAYVDDGYIHDAGEGKGSKRVEFVCDIERAGRYQVQVSYSTGSNRAAGSNSDRTSGRR
ncbi:MAG: DUF1549 domain-containing protein [Pirellulaceae bacterium]